MLEVSSIPPPLKSLHLSHEFPHGSRFVAVALTLLGSAVRARGKSLVKGTCPPTLSFCRPCLFWTRSLIPRGTANVYGYEPRDERTISLCQTIYVSYRPDNRRACLDDNNDQAKGIKNTCNKIKHGRQVAGE